jgi:hypothetical protein
MVSPGPATARWGSGARSGSIQRGQSHTVARHERELSQAPVWQVSGTRRGGDSQISLDFFLFNHLAAGGGANAPERRRT